VRSTCQSRNSVHCGRQHFSRRHRLPILIAGLLMHIAQVGPLIEAIPPKFYGGTERVVSWLTEELIALGHEVTPYASCDSVTSARLEAVWPRALRLAGSVRDPQALHMLMLERVYQSGPTSISSTATWTITRSRYSHGSPRLL